jgi:ribosomal protein S12 methylthiotransferase accessory factor
MPDSEAGSRRLHECANLATDDLRQDILTCRGVLESRAIEVLVLDQTRPDVGVPVVRVAAPGLRHFWARFGPGRLYEAPVRAGWISQALDEGQLNPFVVQM